MHAHLLLLTGAMLLAAPLQPRIESPLAGPLGIAQQASLNQVDILLELSRSLPETLRARAGEAIFTAQRAHEAAVRNLIVVERGVVTADYRRWKLRRAIQAIVRADKQCDSVMDDLLREAPEEYSGILAAARDRVRSEAARAVAALRSLDSRGSWGGAGASSTLAALEERDQKDSERQSSKRQDMHPVRPPPCR